MKRNIISLLILLFFTVFLTNKALIGQVDINKIHSIIEESHQKWDIPGLSVGIVYHGDIIYSGGVGVKEAGSDIHVDGQTMYAIASNTKAFIATALAILVDEGKIDWKDPVQTYLPGFYLNDPCASEMLTIEDLLCHRAGLGTYGGDVIWYKSESPASEVIQKVKYLEPAYEFRAGYGYSNLMFITAGEIIYSVTGETWNNYLEHKIFKELSMKRTITSTKLIPQLQNVATPHKPESGKNMPIAWTNWDNMGAAGGIISCTDDMLKWLALHLSEGITSNDTIFSRREQIKMWTPHNSHVVTDRSTKLFKDRHFSGYGLGWGISDYSGKKVVSHGGGYDGMYSRVVMVPEEELGIVILTNSMKGISTSLSYQIIDYLLDLEVVDWDDQYLEWAKGGMERRAKEISTRKNDRLKGTKPSLALENYTGTYHDPMYGDIIIKEANQSLEIQFENAPALGARLSHWHLDVFKIDWNETHAWFDFGTLQFVLDNNGHSKELRFDVPNQDIFFHEIHAVKD